MTLLRGKWRTAAACISLLQLAVVGHGPLLVGHGQDESVKAGCVTAPSDEEVLLLHVEVELVAWCRSSAQGQEVALLLPTVDVGVGTQRGR